MTAPEVVLRSVTDDDERAIALQRVLKEQRENTNRINQLSARYNRLRSESNASGLTQTKREKDRINAQTALDGRRELLFRAPWYVKQVNLLTIDVPEQRRPPSLTITVDGPPISTPSSSAGVRPKDQEDQEVQEDQEDQEDQENQEDQDAEQPSTQALDMMAE